jgi:AraC-like DNA-binding protein
MYRERPSRVAGAVLWTAPVDGTESRILPDGCMDLIWVDDGTLMVAGPDTQALLYRGRAGTTLTGLRFAPGFGPIVCGIPAHPLVNTRVDLDALWPASDVDELVDRLDGAGNPGALLEDVVLKFAHRNREQILVDEIVAGVRSGHRVAAIAEMVGLSSRQLHRRCLDAFGYGAKTLARILRMVDALDLARTGVTFADTAARAGYFDQSHMAREVQDLTGLRLGQLVVSDASGANKSTELPSGSRTTA